MNRIEFMPSSPKKIEVKHKYGMENSLFSMHIHNNFEIYFTLCDGNKFCVGTEFYPADKNDVFLFNNTDVHKITVTDPDRYERYVVMFAPSLFPKNDPELGGLLECFDGGAAKRNHKISLSDEQAKELTEILEKMILCGNENASRADLKRKLYLAQILLLLSDVKQTAAQRNDPRTENDPRLNAILDYIRTHCDYPVTLDELSKEFYLNKYYLCRMFKNKLGFGISDYIESCRLSNAIPLLRAGVPISTVALKTGFGSDTYFISTFKKHFGISPKKYVKEVTQ